MKTRQRRPPAPWLRRLILLLMAAGLAVGGWSWVQAWRHARDRELGLRLVQRGHFADAEPMLARVMARDAADVEVVKALARISADAQQLDRAADYLSAWCALRPAEREPLQLRMECNKRLGR